MKSNLEGRTVLVTGANGFLGPEVVRQTYGKGARVIATSIEDKPKGGWPSDVEYVQADLTKKEDARELLAARGVHDVLDLKALFSLSAGPEALNRVNVEATRNLLEMAVTYDVERYVGTSSGTVYKADKSMLVETDELAPGEVYGQSKLDQERLIQEFMGEVTRSGRLRCGILRPSVILGLESMYGGKVAAFTHFAIQALAQGMTAVPGDGTTELCFVHVEDCAAMHLHMLENDLVSDKPRASHLANNYIFNSVDVSFAEGEDRAITNNDLADLVLRELNLPWYRSMLAGKKLPLPEKPLKWLSQYNDIAINWLKEKNLPVPTVSLDSGSVELMYVGHVSMSSEKIRDTGFVHKHPYTEEWMGEVIRQCIDSNWVRLLGNNFSWLPRLIK